MHSKIWTDMFVLAIPVAEKMLRPVIVYAFLVLGLRLAGKRELAQLNPFDLVVLLTLSNTVQNAIIGNDNSLTGGLVGAFTLLSVNYMVIRYLFKHRRLDQIFEGKPTLLIEDGKVLRDGLARELLTNADLLTVLHRQGFDSHEEVQRCVLEPGGTFYIQRKLPDVDSLHHGEVMAQLKDLTTKLETLLQREAT
jgi:uncharacterized membrane protein YcaP (DUF421 family)